MAGELKVCRAVCGLCTSETGMDQEGKAVYLWPVWWWQMWPWGDSSSRFGAVPLVSIWAVWKLALALSLLKCHSYRLSAGLLNMLSCFKDISCLPLSPPRKKRNLHSQEHFILSSLSGEWCLSSQAPAWASVLQLSWWGGCYDEMQWGGTVPVSGKAYNFTAVRVVCSVSQIKL